MGLRRLDARAERTAGCVLGVARGVSVSVSVSACDCDLGTRVAFLEGLDVVWFAGSGKLRVI